MSIYKRAKDLAAQGFFVFPLIENGKFPAVPDDFTGRATDNANDLARFWVDTVMEIEHQFNIGIATSKFHGGGALLVVDVDNSPGKNGSEQVIKLELEGFEFPKTLTQLTPTGGFHYIYSVKKAVKQGAHVLAQGIDIRSRGGYIVGAGSMIDGKPYKINKNPIVPAPKWIIAQCEKAAKSEVKKKKPSKKVSQKGAISRGRDYLLNQAPIAVEGDGGDQTTFRVAARLKDIGLTEDNALDLMLDNYNDSCQPPWGPDELKQKISNAYAYGQNAAGADSPEADFDPVIEDEQEQNDPVSELNKDFAFIVIGGKSTILHKSVNGETSYITVQAFHDLLKADTLQVGNGRRKQLSELWLASHKRATFTSIELLPEKTAPKGVYNLWRGFTCKPLAEDDVATNEMIEGVSMFKEHALENICLGNAELYDWLMAYFAHLIQKPYEKPLTCVVFKGKKGVGKNALIDRIGNLFGSHYLLTSSRRYLISNFNKHLSNLVLMVLDEAFWSGDKQAEGILKDLITGNTHLIEQKGREMYKAKNILRVCILGNEDWVVPATEDERRFAVFNIGDKRRKDKKFFIKMRKLIDLKGGNRLLMRELLDIDLSKIDINDAPETQGLLDQKIESLIPIHSWWLGSLHEGAILHLDFAEDWPKTIGREQLRSAFLSHAKSRGVRGWLPDAATFGRHLGQALPGIESKRLRGSMTRVRQYILPDLMHSRIQFELFIGHKIEWEDVEPSNVIDAVNLFK